MVLLILDTTLLENDCEQYIIYLKFIDKIFSVSWR
jgi:hypothetical protein